MQKSKTYHIKTFGCQRNKSDSERITTVIESAGYNESSLKNADLVIFNTCSVRQMAEDRAQGQIHEAKKRSQQTVVTGCLKNQEDFQKKQSEVDLFIDIEDIADLPNKLNMPKHDCSHCQKSNCHDQKNYLNIKPKYTHKSQAYVPIITGCDNFCTYCIVPHVRGREKSRSPESILTEIKALVSSGCQQITLLGENVNSYKHEAKGSLDPEVEATKISFVDLLKQITDLAGEFRVFFITSNPKDFSVGLVKLVAENKKLCPYLHLPIQSGSNKILVAMNRKYTREQYLDSISEIKKQIPDAAITSDIIVGFPGETEEDFQKSVEICEEVKFDQVYIARFSPRPGTAAEKLEDDVPLNEKKKREKILVDIVKKTALSKNEQLIGKTNKVLVETSKPENSKFVNFGKNENFKTVKFESDKYLSDTMVSVEITEAIEWGLYGKQI